MNNNQNVDLDEIKKFNESASKWWDKKGEFKPLHEINPIRMSFIHASTQLDKKVILDLGCGGGILTESLAQENQTQVTGIDLASEAIQAAKTHAQQQEALDIEYIITSAEELAAQRPQHYDVICCMEMLEHVPSPIDIIDACSKLVKPGGDLFLSTINRNPLAYGMAIVAAEYVLNLLPRGTHDYEKFIRPSELESWCRQHNLHIQALKGLSYNPITKNYYLSDNIKVNYLVHLKNAI